MPRLVSGDDPATIATPLMYNPTTTAVILTNLIGFQARRAAPHRTVGRNKEENADTHFKCAAVMIPYCPHAHPSARSRITSAVRVRGVLMRSSVRKKHAKP